MISRILAVMMAMCLGVSAKADSITVFAAASLRNALEEVADNFEASSGHQVVLSFAGSSALARQIQYGAPANLFISANPEWMDHLQAQGLIQEDSRNDLLSNRLVLISHSGRKPVEISPDLDLKSLMDDGRLALAMVQSVPAGIYARAALEHLGQWAELAPRAVQTDNVRATLALVALGEAELGIVYASDALSEPKVTQIGLFPTTSHPAILYPIAIPKRGDTPAAREFAAYLRQPRSSKIFEHHGFGVVAQP